MTANRKPITTINAARAHESLSRRVKDRKGTKGVRLLQGRTYAALHERMRQELIAVREVE